MGTSKEKSPVINEPEKIDITDAVKRYAEKCQKESSKGADNSNQPEKALKYESIRVYDELLKAGYGQEEALRHLGLIDKHKELFVQLRNSEVDLKNIVGLLEGADSINFRYFQEGILAETYSKTLKTLMNNGMSREQAINSLKRMNDFIFCDEYVTVYHGANSRTKAENIQMYGLRTDQTFYLSPQKSIAENAAGPDGKVLSFRIPKDEALNILGNREPYAGIYGEGKQFSVCGERAKRLSRYLQEKISVY